MASILSDVYKQYKDDTEFVAGWLAEESLKCGYVLATLGDQPPKGPGRLKGKARKQVGAHNYASCVQLTDKTFRQNKQPPINRFMVIAM